MAYYYDDEEYTTSDTEESLELCEREILTEPRHQNQTEAIKDWDYRVAKEITRIHREAFKKSQNRTFSNWVNHNLDHLQKLHSLSNLDMPEETFYTFIYDHVI